MAPEEAWTEQQRDHAEAVAQYTQGRVLLQRGSHLEGDAQNRLFAEALRCMQRAWWFDHDLVSIMDDIFPLSLTLNHSGGSHSVCHDRRANSRTCRSSSSNGSRMVLAEQNEFDRALNLYRKIASRERRSTRRRHPV